VGELHRRPAQLRALADARLVNQQRPERHHFADPDGLFAQPTLPTGNDAPDSTMPVQNVGTRATKSTVKRRSPNGRRQLGSTTLEMAGPRRDVRYRVGEESTALVAGSSRSEPRLPHNPAAVGTGRFPFPYDPHTVPTASR